MRNYFSINGYWKNDKEPFEGYVVTNFDDIEEESLYKEEDIFFFGLSEYNIQEAIELKENTTHDFVITSYIKL